MPATRMETRLEQVEAHLKQLPAMEEALIDVKAQMAEFRTVVTHLTQRMEEFLPRTSNPQGLATVTESHNISPGESPIHSQTPHFDRHPSIPPSQNQHLPTRATDLYAYQARPYVKKIKMPLFDGGQTEVWLYQAEHYFALHEMSEPAKLGAVKICLMGPAQVWLQPEENKHPFVTWHELKVQIALRFESAKAMTIRQRFLMMQQETMAGAYREGFELLTLHLNDVFEATLVVAFINGLDPRIRADLMVRPPETLQDTIRVAVRIKGKNRILSQLDPCRGSGLSPRSEPFLARCGEPRAPPWPNYKPKSQSKLMLTPPTRSPQRNSIGPSSPLLLSELTQTGSSSRKTSSHNSSCQPLSQFKRFSVVEAQAKREKGLCFRCDDR